MLLSMKMLYRFLGLNGTLEIIVESREGKYGYSVYFPSQSPRHCYKNLKLQEAMVTNVRTSQVTVFLADGQTKSSFYPFNGVTEELKTFFNDVSQAILEVRMLRYFCHELILPNLHIWLLFSWDRKMIASNVSLGLVFLKAQEILLC